MHAERQTCENSLGALRRCSGRTDKYSILSDHTVRGEQLVLSEVEGNHERCFHTADGVNDLGLRDEILRRLRLLRMTFTLQCQLPFTLTN